MIFCHRIQPILYRVVVIVDESQAHGLWKIPGVLTNRNWRNTQIANTPQFVRHLISITNCAESDLLEIISTFPNLENLAIWDGRFVSSEILEKMSDLPLRMLSLCMTDTSLYEAIQTFANLTHLEIRDMDRSTSDLYKVLVELPKLTHLCFCTSAHVDDTVVLNLLEHCASLRVLVFLLLTGAGFVNVTIALDNPRCVVLLDRMDMKDLLEEWKRSAHGLIGFWELAEIIVDARKGNLFKDRSSSVFSRKTWMNHLNDDGMRWYKEWSRGSKNCV